MSFILDALRKSEIERQRQSGPSIAERPTAREDRRLPIALVAIGVLLAVNVGVLLFFLLRDGAEPAAVDGAAVPPVATEATLPAGRSPGESPPRAATAASSDAPLAAPPAAAPGPESRPPDAPDPTLLPEAPIAMPGARVTYTDAPPPPSGPLAAQATGLPELSVDLHIYADDPAKRAVFINGRRYAQGATIAEGPTVEEITRDGAVLRYRGQRFTLPRL